MNFILCNEKCKHQKDGYCSLEGSAKITNAVTSSKSGCCYYEENGKKISDTMVDVNSNSNIESKS